MLSAETSLAQAPAPAGAGLSSVAAPGMATPDAEPAPATPASPWQRARISAIVPRTPGVSSFFFSLSRPFAFRAGQHVDLRLTAPDGYQARRSYSIASAPELLMGIAGDAGALVEAHADVGAGAPVAAATNAATERSASTLAEVPSETLMEAPMEAPIEAPAEAPFEARDEASRAAGGAAASQPRVGAIIELTIERLADGEVSPYFHDVAQVGDEVELRGPLGGHFVWTVDEGGPLILIGGGSGVVPLMSMLRHRAARASKVPLLLLFSARTWEDVIFRDELLALHERRDGFELVLTLTREGGRPEAARRAGDFARRVDAPMVRALLARLPAAPLRAYVCGPNAFVEAAAQGLVGAGMAAALIRTERYGG